MPPGRFACADCGAVNDVTAGVAPVRDSDPPKLAPVHVPDDMQVERIGQPRGSKSSDPYRTLPAVREIGGLRLRWRSREGIWGWLAAAFLTVVAGAFFLPLAVPVALLFGYLALTVSTSTFELSSEHGTVELFRHGLPAPDLVPELIPPTRASHVALYRAELPNADEPANVIYGLEVTDTGGNTKRYRFSDDIERARIAWRILYSRSRLPPAEPPALPPA